MQAQLGGFVVVIVSSSNLFCFHSSQPNQLTSTAKVSSSRPTAWQQNKGEETCNLGWADCSCVRPIFTEKAPGKGYAIYLVLLISLN